MARTSERDGSTAEADAKVAAIATAALRSRQLHRKQHVVSPSDAANELLADRILEALSSGAPLPSPKLALGADFGEADDEECFGATAGVDFINQMRIDRLEASAHGRAALKAMGSCKESDEDEAHWGGPDSELLEAVVTDNCSPRIHVMRARNPHPNPSPHTHPNPSLTPTPKQAHWGGPDSELLEAVVTDNCSPRIHVMRARNPFNPVALFTPLAESPLCAVAAETIQASEPIALYLGELTDEISLEGEGKADNTYL